VRATAARVDVYGKECVEERDPKRETEGSPVKRLIPPERLLRWDDEEGTDRIIRRMVPRPARS